MKYSSALSSMFMAITEGLLPASENPIGELQLSFPIIVSFSVLCFICTHTLHPSLSAAHHPRWMEKVTWSSKNANRQPSKGDGGSARALEQQSARVQTSRVREEFLACGSNFFSSLCFSLLFFFIHRLKLLPLCLDESFIFFRQIITATRDVTHKKMLIFSHSSPPASI